MSRTSKVVLLCIGCLLVSGAALWIPIAYSSRAREDEVINWLRKAPRWGAMKNLGTVKPWWKNAIGIWRKTAGVDAHQDPYDHARWYAEGQRIKGNKEVLEKLVQTKDPRVRLVDVVRALYWFGDDSSVPGLLGSLNSNQNDVREWAAAALGRIGSVDAVDALCNTVVRDPDKNVRASAVIALGEIGDSRARSALRAALKDKNEDVRNAAAEALKIIQAAPATREAASTQPGGKQ